MIRTYCLDGRRGLGALELPAAVVMSRAVFSSPAPGIWSLGEGGVSLEVCFSFSAKAFLKSGFLYLSLPGGLESHSLHDALWTRSNTEAFAGTD